MSGEEEQQKQNTERSEMENAFLANQERRQRKPSGVNVASHTVSSGPETENPGPVPEFTGPAAPEEQKKKKGIFGR
jgi:hypothetical protein